MTQALSIEEAAAAFGQPVSHIEAVARGRKMKGQETLAIPTRFAVETRQFVSPLGDQFQAVTRRELWGDGRLIWAVEHSPGVYKTLADAAAALGTAVEVAAGGLEQRSEPAIADRLARCCAREEAPGGDAPVRGSGH